MSYNDDYLYFFHSFPSFVGKELRTLFKNKICGLKTHSAYLQTHSQ